MWINRTKYEVEKLKYRQRISYLEILSAHVNHMIILR